MSDSQLPGVEIDRPPYWLNVKLNKGRHRDIDLRAVARVERSFEARETWVFWSVGAEPLEIHYSEFDRVHRAWRVHQERSAAAPGPIGPVVNMDEQPRRFAEIDDLHVFEWYRERDGKGRPERVGLQVDVTIAGYQFAFIRMFASPGSVNQLIDMLTSRRESVWPTT